MSKFSRVMLSCSIALLLVGICYGSLIGQSRRRGVTPASDYGYILDWPMNRDANIWADSSSNNYAATATNLIVFQTNAPSGRLASYLFDGSTTYASGGLGIMTNLNSVSQNTYVAWINVASDGEGNSGRILDNRPVAANKGMQFLCLSEAGGFVALYGRSYYTGTEQLAISTVSIALNTWVHVAYVLNEDGDNKGKLYLNGSLMTLTTDNAGTGAIDLDLTVPFTIGDQANFGRAFDGSMTGVGVFNEALTAAQVTNIYDNGVTPTDSNVLAYWAMTNLPIDDLALKGTWPHAMGDKVASGANWVQAADGTNYYLLNVNDYCYTFQDSSLCNTQSVTFGCIARPRASDNTGALMSKRKAGNEEVENEWLLRQHTDGTGTIYANVHMNSNVYVTATGPTLPTGQWSWVEACYTAPSNLVIMVNGVEYQTNVTVVGGTMTHKLAATNRIFYGTYSDAKLDGFTGDQFQWWVSTNDLRSSSLERYQSVSNIIDGL